MWDRRSTKTDMVTGRSVPDESKRVPLLTYPNARPAHWPKADYIVGNPPFIGTARMREDLGDGYAETLRAAYPLVPESADFVMYWWHKAATLTGRGAVRRFGLITTNSLRQTFNRRVVLHHLKDGGAEGTPAQSLSLLFAIPDHPWVDATAQDEKKAAVRIAMTVGAAGAQIGQLHTVIEEEPDRDGSSNVTLATSAGKIAADLSLGTDVTVAVPLKSNDILTYRGVQLIGSGFLISRERAAALGLRKTPGLEQYIREYRNGRDLTESPRDVLCIDLFDLQEETVRQQFPEIYQHVLTTVKPERDANNRESYRRKWWIFGEPRRDLRPAIATLARYIATVETAKHRIFQFLDGSVMPDNKLVVIALEDAFALGVLSSRIHIVFALSRGALLEDRPVYPKTECFDPFPFPDCDEQQKATIRAIAEELDAHRKRVQAAHPKLSLTAMYNVLEALREGRALTNKEQAIHDQGLVSILRQLHDQLDLEVVQAYGWQAMAHELHGLQHGDTLDPVTGWPAPKPEDREAAAAQLEAAQKHFDQKILTRLVALNAERAAEEAQGKIRWLRPEYQNPAGQATQTGLDVTTAKPKKGAKGAKTKPAKAKKLAWPKTMAERVRAVEQALKGAGVPLTPEALAKTCFLRTKAAEVAEILETLIVVGRAQKGAEGYLATA